jgi:crotonobetaine/carnitine-CoA ligase
MFLAIATGSRLVLDARFSASRYWERAAASGATHAALLGAMAGMLLAQPESPADRAHRVTTAFAPDMPAELWPRFAQRYGVEEIIAAYAGTETNQVISATKGRRSSPGYMGWVVDGYAARVVDAFDCDVPDGAPGELVLRSELPFSFCLGYLNRPDETLTAMRNLWWHTGDRVVREPDGRFRFVDRLKDMIRRRGENISTWEVEEALLTHPDIAEAAVFGVPSPLGDEDVAAAVVLKPGCRVTGPSVIAHVAGRIAHFAVPRYIDVRTDLPHTENGKVSKGPLRAQGITATMWDRGETGAPQPGGS